MINECLPAVTPWSSQPPRVALGASNHAEMRSALGRPSNPELVPELSGEPTPLDRYLAALLCALSVWPV